MTPAGVTAGEPARQPFWDWEDVAIFFGLGLPCLVASVLLSRGFLWAIGWQPASKAMVLLPTQFLGYGLWFVGLYVLLKVKYDQPFLPSLGWVRPRRGFWRSLFWGPMLAFGVAFLGLALRTPPIEMPFRDLLSDKYSIMMTGFFAVTLGPLAEELAFRGFLMPVLVRSIGKWGGIVAAALPFALLHGPQYSWSWRHLLLLAVAGVFFGWVRHSTGSTVTATMTHFTYNLTFFSAYLVQQGRH